MKIKAKHNNTKANDSSNRANPRRTSTRTGILASHIKEEEELTSLKSEINASASSRKETIKVKVKEDTEDAKAHLNPALETANNTVDSKEKDELYIALHAQ
jgi:hypothetical protein